MKTITPDGLEALFPGPAAPGGSVGPLIPDFVLYKMPVPYRQHGMVDAENRDLNLTICANRDHHYERMKRTALELKPRFQGRTVVLVAPGPSLGKLPQDETDIGDAIVVGINRAIRAVPCHFAFIQERCARREWIEGNNGVLVPWIPDYTNLVTVPEASGWLTEIWPDDSRYYCYAPFGECEIDCRFESLQEAISLFSCVLTPCLALSFLQQMEVEKILLIGFDFSMDGARNIYWDQPADQHPNQHQERAILVQDHDSRIAFTSPELLYHMNIMEAVCYWIERSARIPIRNCSMGGIFKWNNMTLAEAMEPQEPTIPFDDFQPNWGHDVGSNTRDERGAARSRISGAESQVSKKVAGSDVQPALASV